MSAAPSAISRAEALKVFWFLVDAPMFIDAALVERLRDAIIRPDNIVTGGTEQSGRTEEQGREYGLTGAGDVNVPFVVKMAVQGDFGHTYTRTDETGKTHQFSIPRTPERLLEELVAFYLKHFPSRVITVNPPIGEVRLASDEHTHPYSKLDEVCAVSGPRPLILVDAPSGSKLMPMAGEFTDGTVDVTYDRLIEELSKGGAEFHRFERHSKRTPQEKTAAWNEIIKNFDARLAMHVLESAGRDHKGAKFDWIDFRLPWKNAGDPSPLHLHLVAGGRYSMGTFAHAFINRGFSNGVRIVGSLKTAGDINVLAIYER